MEIFQKEEMKTICVRVKDNLLKRMDSVAKTYGCTRAQIMRHGFELAIKQLEKKESSDLE